jgi:hypothetical protein
MRLVVYAALLAASHTALVAQTAVKVGQWEVHEGNDGLIPFNTNTPAERQQALDKATIPSAGDKGWKTAETVSAMDAAAKYIQPSKIKKPKQELDFTYFQSIVTVPPGITLKSFQVRYDSVDDAARVWIFNEKFPGGK